MNRILIAVKNSEIEIMGSFLESKGYEVHKTESIIQSWKVPENIKVAFIDEDFIGIDTGWRLASEIRQSKHPIRIVMITRKNPKKNQMSLYDSMRGFPISGEGVIGEIEGVSISQQATEETE